MLCSKAIWLIAAALIIIFAAFGAISVADQIRTQHSQALNATTNNGTEAGFVRVMNESHLTPLDGHNLTKTEHAGRRSYCPNKSKGWNEEYFDTPAAPDGSLGENEKTRIWWNYFLPVALLVAVVSAYLAVMIVALVVLMKCKGERLWKKRADPIDMV